MYPDPQVTRSGVTSDGLPYYDYSSGAASVGVRAPPALEGMPLESLAVEGSGFRLKSQDPWLQTLTGIAYGAGRVIAEPVLQIGDLLQVGNELGRSLVTGEAPRDINYLSGVGQMSGQGASTAQIINGGFISLMRAPDRIATAYQAGEYGQMGEEIGALGVGAGAAAFGARGAIPNARIGLQMAAEDFGASGLGQRVGASLDQMNYRLGNVNYAVAPQEVSAGGLSLDRTGVGRAAATGEFSINDWSGYPSGVPKPQGPFRLIEGAEYELAKVEKAAANNAYRQQNELQGQPVDVHEIQPIKFGGSPTDLANKIVLPRDLHQQQVTPWWNKMMRDINGR